MLPASKSSGVQCLSGPREARLTYAMGHTESPDCACSDVTPKPSILALQDIREGQETSSTASQSLEKKAGGAESPSATSPTMTY